MGLLTAIWGKAATRRAFFTVPTESVPDKPYAQEPLSVDECYVCIALKSLWVVDARRLWKTYHGIVHAFSTVTYPHGKESFHALTTPARLAGIDANNLDRVISGTSPILGPVPYCGGSLELEVGLCSMLAADLSTPFVELLEKCASIGGVSLVAAARPFLDPIKLGLSALVKVSKQATLEVGLSHSFDPPVTGWYVVAGDGNLNPNRVKINPIDYGLIDSFSETPITHCPYIVFTITKSFEKPDYLAIPELRSIYHKVKIAVESRRAADARQLLEMFRRTAMFCYDLIPRDAERLATVVESRVAMALSPSERNEVAVRSAQHQLPDFDGIALYDS